MNQPVKIGNIKLSAFPLLLAPMEDVSDFPFRHLCKMLGADVVITEFISSEGLIRNASKSLKKLEIYDEERPVGIQIFGNDIKHMREAAVIAEDSNPDFIDINYGCPVKKVANSGAGAGILRDIPKMVRMTKEIVENTHLPVTVKTRLGWDDDTKHIITVAEALQDVGIAAISIHGRTRIQMFKGKADWTLIGEVKNNPRMLIPVFGNGDVKTVEQAFKVKEKYNVDGVMIGRGAIGNPWLFRDIKHYGQTFQKLPSVSLKEKADIVKTHLIKTVEWKGERRGILEMRKHYAGYFKNIPNFKPMRMKLVTTEDLNKLIELIDSIPDNFHEN